MKINKTVLAASAMLGAMTAFATSAAAEENDFAKITIDNTLKGTAFVVDGNLAGLRRKPELVVSAFGEFAFGEFGPIPPAAGTVTMFKKQGWRRNGQLDNWEMVTIVSEAENITFPNRPTIANVKGCIKNQERCDRRAGRGRHDVIVPGGYFFDTFIGQARGSITWWENTQNGNEWIRHDVVTDSPFSYHSALYEDFNGDGIKDIMSTGEDAGNPQAPEDDVIELHLFAGTEEGDFVGPQTVSIGGGGLIEAYDVDEDGDMDVVSPQFFGPVSGQPFVPVFARDASVASFVWFENLGDGTFAKHAIGVDQGPGFAIVPVADLLGDGVTRWIATNHTNQNVDFPPFSLYPEPAVYEFTPGEDPRQPWAVRTLSAPGDFPVQGSVGQAAPGFANAGHLNDDDLLDIAVSGDGARGVYWMEQQADGTFITKQLPESEGYGQSGGPVIRDLNRSGQNEVVFGSFDQNEVSIWSKD